ncbi:MAG: glycerate kinase [Lachnospirales bacterium]
MNLKDDAYRIINSAIEAALPYTAVQKALEEENFDSGRIFLVSIGKAAWSMARATSDILKDKIEKGIVITKYEHSKGAIPNLDIYEAGHPISDENSYKATKKALDLVRGLKEDDTVVFLISGGGSALFEAPLLDLEEMEDINNQLLGCGASIVEINTIRKRLSSVKGGKFAQTCKPAKIFSIVLSDIINNPLDMIASGPAFPDSSTTEDALKIIDKYNLRLSVKAIELMHMDTPKEISNTTTKITGSVEQLCYSAQKTCMELGYEPIILTTSLECEAKEAGKFLGSIGKYNKDTKKPLAFIVGGETVVRLTGKGLGGRNQELALAAAEEIRGLNNIGLFSIGSDGTDGPTDAAGGYVDGESGLKLMDMGVNIHSVLANNDSYNALKNIDGLILTGPTGTNVNDLAVLLVG